MLKSIQQAMSRVQHRLGFFQMQHIKHLQTNGNLISHDFLVRATGRFYTHEKVAEHLIASLANVCRNKFSSGQVVRVIDPFAGDGRLVEWLVHHWVAKKLPKVRWDVTLWDVDATGLAAARARVDQLIVSGEDVTLHCKEGDAFHLAESASDSHDLVITNPPWELLKPDRRELSSLDATTREQYVAQMKQYDAFLANKYPDSQPQKKFAGWGTNLSRVGLDVCDRVCRSAGLIAIVLPASFLADDQSIKLRQKMLSHRRLEDVAYFPAEVKLFGKADVATITAVWSHAGRNGVNPFLTRYDENLKAAKPRRLSVKKSFLDETGYVLPVSMGAAAIRLLQELTERFPSWASLEGHDPSALWAGREIDETGSQQWLVNSAQGSPFVKGRMIGRFEQRELPSLVVSKKGWGPPSSTGHERIVWRDVSRPNQKRRLIATIIPAGWVAGNSLGVAHFRDASGGALRALLGVMSSIVFEFQLRGHLATGHVSLSSLRKVRVPHRHVMQACPPLIRCADSLLAGDMSAEPTLEAVVAKLLYRLKRTELELILDLFPKVDADEKDEILRRYDTLPDPAEISNNATANLSAVDMQMVRVVPPGGNWKDIPESIPSKRLEQIRVSFKQGKGSRSTYYGRLRADMPSYTINTYFNRPGNGCHMHYEQDRVLSQREAARLQSFPDSFAFSGPQSSVNNQIGNAVPPLLAFQIARSLGTPGFFVDLFAGAGGLGLGFLWAGWQPVVTNDIDERFLETYSNNVHDSVVVGSITDTAIRQRLVKIARKARSANKGAPFWVLGGPPCQGFSTAGYKRVTGDERNLLFWDYQQFLKELKPDGFVFENVTGLLNMHGGKVFTEVKAAFRSVVPSVVGWVLRSEEYAVPQRRSRVILVGGRSTQFEVKPPPPLTSHQPSTDLFADLKRVASVHDALEDLPELIPGQDGSHLQYRSHPRSLYQKFVRGWLSPDQYLDAVRDA